MFGESVTRRRRVAGADDRYGDPTYTWATTTLEGAAFDPGDTREPTEVGRSSTITNSKLFFRAAVDVTTSDQVVVRGVTYEVAGDPAVWVSPRTGVTEGTVLELRVVTG